jgi:nucleotide-binding universal stress UspA family protein
MLRTVLVPTDLAEGLELVMRFVSGLQTLGVKRAVLVHVVDPSGLEEPVLAATVDELRGRLREAGRPLETAGIHVHARICTGPAQAQILALAHEVQVDAIVCGSHGRGVVDQLFEGSVSDRLLRDSSVPVLCARFDLLRNAKDPARLAASFATKLLVPTDFSATAMRALMVAFDLPPKAITSMFIMHCLGPALTGEKRRRAEEGAEFELRNLVAMAAEKGINASAVINRLDCARGILAEIDERRVTGVVVGTHGRSAFQEALMGSVSMTLLRQASCPVMVVS